MVVVVVSHGYNMLHFPYLEDDEGTYFSQAWSVFHVGRLAPYTYFYDHAPLGWVQIGLWQLLTFDHGFGYEMASGRILMLFFQLGSALLVLAIGRRCTGKIWVGLLAALLFTLSAYGIFYHRRILLDNIATFWLLVSIYMLVGPVTLRRIWLSAVAIGIAVLSKEITFAAVPALAVLAARQAPRPGRPFAVIGWLGLALGICSTYVLLALLKGELFPAGSGLGGAHPHVSLICSLQWQASRGSSGGLFDPSSAFWQAASGWGRAEPLLVIDGTAAALVAVIALRRNVFISMLGWVVISIWLFLARGAFQPYIFPLFEHLGGFSYAQIASLLNGYVLAQSPDDITLGQIVSAVDGPIAVGDFGEPHQNGACDHEGQCVLLALWADVGEHMRQHLLSFTLADIAARAQGLRRPLDALT